MSQVAAAVTQREKRKTAGQRMTALVGQAQEDDDAFWNHDTWAEDDSGNDSFRDSDEDSELKKDAFDSDFNDSETDNDEEEQAAGDAEERELQRQERSNRQRKTNYVDIAKGGRALMQKAKGRIKGSKRAMGDGMNAGIVLNFPPVGGTGGMPVSSAAAASGPTAQPLPARSSTAPTSVPSSPRKASVARELGIRTTLASARQRRSQTRKRDTRNASPTYSSTQAVALSNKKVKPSTGATKPRKQRKQQFAQEELLLEAVHQTEPENLRWLLARKRIQESAADQDKDAAAALRDKNRGKNVIQKYHSRRGCLITLTFPEMDAVPEILSRSNKPPTKPESLICAITGKPARYRDPKTKMAYYDASAFKELRRRLAAKERLDQRTKPSPKPSEAVAASTTPSNPSIPQKTSSSAAQAKSSTVNGKVTTVSLANEPSTPSNPNSGFVVDLGGVPKSPGSTRSSSRKWKPSEKMLQGLATSSSNRATTNGTKESQPVVVPPVTASGNTEDGDTPMPMAPSMPVLTTSKSKTKNAASSTSTKPKVVKKARAPVKAAKPKTTNRTTKGTTTAATKTRARPKDAAKTATSGDPSKEHVYVIPPDGNNGLKEPCYVTQSELIMKAISDYSRSHEGQANPPAGMPPTNSKPSTSTSTTSSTPTTTSSATPPPPTGL